MAQTIRLGDHSLDLAAGTLRDARGGLVPMRPQAWAVLELLARQPDRVVTKAEMLNSVWPGLVVTDGSIAQAVKDLRVALGSDGHRLIRAVARRGYMLVSSESGASATGSTSGNLPRLNSLFGRDAELSAIRTLLDVHRLVTVIGGGGVGKTAFAAAAAHAHVEGGRGPATWVDLSRLTDAALLPTTVARSMNLPVSPGDEPLRGLLMAVGTVAANRAASSTATELLVLDNAEHLLDAVAALASALLETSIDLRLLVTSQAPLHVGPEHLFRLSTLRVPESTEPFSSAAQSAAVEMFCRSARAVDHRFELNESNMDGVVRLCRRLDGLPLAIRLAAGRVHVLGLSGLENQLADRVLWLASPDRDAPSRQQTLAAALTWSYGLLGSTEQKLWRHLGVFIGGFTIESAFEMARAIGVDHATLTMEFDELVERSMISVESDMSPPRYRMLESQREQALKALDREGERDRANDHHARTMAHALVAAEEDFWSTPDHLWLARWAPELENVRAALSWSATRDPTTSSSLVAASIWLYRLLDLNHELRRQADAADGASMAALDDAHAARLSLARGYLESGRSGRRGHDWAIRAEGHARTSGLQRVLYLALCQRGANIVMSLAQIDALLQEAAALERTTWPPKVRCHRLRAEFAAHNLRGEWALALRAAETGFSLANEADSVLFKAVFGNWRMVALLGMGDADAAMDVARALEPQIPMHHASMAIPYLGTCARVALTNGDFAGTRGKFGQMFELCRSVEWMYFEVFGELYLALALAEGRMSSAARLFGYAQVANSHAWGIERRISALDKAGATLAASIDANTLARLQTEGAALAPDTVVHLVLESTG
jgi:predicted ATPase/DNA-binding winged helix-turn-helix (wHTH) protein